MPGIEQYGEIKDSVVKILNNLKNEIFSAEDKVEVHQECLFSSLVKRELQEYAENENIDKIVVFTRERHGLFDSSFAQYLLSNSKCDLEIIRA
jgi:nucleotide-binding universal stress UspA family protein